MAINRYAWWVLATALLVPAVAPVAHAGEPSPKADTAKAAEQAPVYTCPMHPEVTSDKPGRCPKCGMKLVVKPSAPPVKK